MPEPEEEILADLLRLGEGDGVADPLADALSEGVAVPLRLGGGLGDDDRLTLELTEITGDPLLVAVTVPTEAVMDGEPLKDGDEEDDRLSKDAVIDALAESETVPIEALGSAVAVCGDCDPLGLPEVVAVHERLGLILCVFE